jgi:ligand-binding sensor domain-containing protein
MNQAVARRGRQALLSVIGLVLCAAAPPAPCPGARGDPGRIECLAESHDAAALGEVAAIALAPVPPEEAGKRPPHDARSRATTAAASVAVRTSPTLLLPWIDSADPAERAFGLDAVTAAMRLLRHGQVRGDAADRPAWQAAAPAITDACARRIADADQAVADLAVRCLWDMPDPRPAADLAQRVATAPDARQRSVALSALTDLADPPPDELRALGRLLEAPVAGKDDTQLHARVCEFLLGELSPYDHWAAAPARAASRALAASPEHARVCTGLAAWLSPATSVAAGETGLDLPARESPAGLTVRRLHPGLLRGEAWPDRWDAASEGPWSCAVQLVWDAPWPSVEGIAGWQLYRGAAGEEPTRTQGRLLPATAWHATFPRARCGEPERWAVEAVDPKGRSLARHVADEPVLRRLTGPPGSVFPLPSNWVWAAHSSAAGELWLGGESGLVRVAEGDGTWSWLHPPEGLRPSLVQAILTGAGGTVWIGTHGQGLYRFNPTTGAWTRWRDGAGPGSNYVRALWTDGREEVWVGNQDGSVARHEPATGRWTRWPGPGAAVTGLARLGDGPVWVSTSGGGLLRLDTVTGGWARVGGVPEWISGMVADGGGLWLATRGGGLLRVAAGTAAATAVPPPELAGANLVNAVAIDGRGRVWVGTDAGGVAAWDPRRAAWELPPPLPADRVVSLAVTPSREVWAGTTTGAFRLGVDGKGWDRAGWRKGGNDGQVLTSNADRAGLGSVLRRLARLRAMPVVASGQSVAQLPSGMAFISTRRRVVLVPEGATEAPPALELPLARAWGIAAAPDGGLWVAGEVGGRAGVLRLDREGAARGGPWPLPDEAGKVASVVEPDGADAAWVVANDRVCRVEVRREAEARWSCAKPPGYAPAQVLAPLGEVAGWWLGVDEGLARVTLDAARQVVVEAGEAPELEDRPDAGASGPDGTLWMVGAPDGLASWRPGGPLTRWRLGGKDGSTIEQPTQPLGVAVSASGRVYLQADGVLYDLEPEAVGSATSATRGDPASGR